MKWKSVNSLKNAINQFLIQENGTIAILSGLIFVILIGFAALAIDVGVWYSEKRQLQFAADAGAVGGAIALKTTGKSTMTTYATNDINLNNCSSGNSCSIVINNPPTSGGSAGNVGAVEVLLTKPADMFLANLFLGSTPTLGARSVAGNQVTNNCVVTLNKTGTDINVKGGGTVVSPNCGLYSNSSDSKSVNVTGGGSITTNTVSTVGNVSTSGGGTINASTGTITGAGALSDPYSSIQMPTTPAGCTQTNFQVSSGTQTISPGVYCGGIKLVSGVTLNMNPGVYFMVDTGSGGGSAGNFIAAAQSTINATAGVTIVMTSSAGSTNYGTVTINAGAVTNMSAPTTGSTAGILFFGDRNSSGLTQSFTGGLTQTLNGALYFSTNDVAYSGQSSLAGNPCFQIVSSTVTFTGGSALGNGCPTVASGATLLLEE
jgi:Flp pilus assembly protein TadG